MSRRFTLARNEPKGSRPHADRGFFAPPADPAYCPKSEEIPWQPALCQAHAGAKLHESGDIHLGLRQFDRRRQRTYSAMAWLPLQQ